MIGKFLSASREPSDHAVDLPCFTPGRRPAACPLSFRSVRRASSSSKPSSRRNLHLDPTEVGASGATLGGRVAAKSKETKFVKGASGSRAQHKGAIHSRQDPATSAQTSVAEYCLVWFTHAWLILPSASPGPTPALRAGRPLTLMNSPRKPLSCHLPCQSPWGASPPGQGGWAT